MLGFWAYEHQASHLSRSSRLVTRGDDCASASSRHRSGGLRELRILAAGDTRDRVPRRAFRLRRRGSATVDIPGRQPGRRGAWLALRPHGTAIQSDQPVPRHTAAVSALSSGPCLASGQAGPRPVPPVHAIRHRCSGCPVRQGGCRNPRGDLRFIDRSQSRAVPRALLEQDDPQPAAQVRRHPRGPGPRRVSSARQTGQDRFRKGQARADHRLHRLVRGSDSRSRTRPAPSRRDRGIPVHHRQYPNGGAGTAWISILQCRGKRRGTDGDRDPLVESQRPGLSQRPGGAGREYRARAGLLHRSGVRGSVARRTAIRLGVWRRAV